MTTLMFSGSSDRACRGAGLCEGPLLVHLGRVASLQVTAQLIDGVWSLGARFSVDAKYDRNVGPRCAMHMLYGDLRCQTILVEPVIADPVLGTCSEGGQVSKLLYSSSVW